MNKIKIILSITILIIIIVIIISLLYNYKYPIIIQTWKDRNIPKKYQELVNKVKKLNPKSRYMFFTDNDIDNFILKKYPEYYRIYNNFDYKIQKIDFFRYLAVYYYGGVYLDLDISLNKSLKNINKSNRCVFPLEFERNGDKLLRNQNFKGLIGNYAFYAPKKHPFIKKIINNIVIKRIKIKKEKDYMRYILYTTGPVMVTQSYIDFNNKSLVKIIKSNPYKKSRFGNYGEHTSMGSWKK